LGRGLALGHMVQVIEHLPSKYKALSSTPSPTKTSKQKTPKIPNNLPAAEPISFISSAANP
jgi:hypothetical protein